MSKAYLICICLLLGSCGGSGLDGEYEGRIGSKSEVNILFLNSHEAELRGYWGETLRGTYEKSSIRGKTVDSLVFLGPEAKPFKLRICYEAEDDFLEILSIHSRVFGPGARYVPTEPKTTFSKSNPRLFKLK